jgi:hypothetical protein
MTTENRAEIRAENNSDQARGQLIFNTDTDVLEYWDGENWVSIVSSESILEYVISHLSTDLGDTIMKYIIQNFTTELGDTIISHIINHFTDELGDVILNHITNNVTQKLTDSIMANVSIGSVDETVLVTGSGTSTIDLSVNIEGIATKLVENDFVDSIMKDVKIEVRNGLLISRPKPSEITISLPAGTVNGQHLVWDGTNWAAAAAPPVAKQLKISVNEGEFSTENLIFYGKATGVTSSMRVVGIEPVFSSIDFRRRYLRVDATYQVQEDENIVEWTVSIDNRNFSSAKVRLESVIISYISDEQTSLIGGTQGSIEIVGF